MSTIEKMLALVIVVCTLGIIPCVAWQANTIQEGLRTKFPPNSLYHFKGDDVKYSIQGYGTSGLHAINTRTGETVIISNTDILEKVE